MGRLRRGCHAFILKHRTEALWFVVLLSPNCVTSSGFLLSVFMVMRPDTKLTTAIRLEVFIWRHYSYSTFAFHSKCPYTSKLGQLNSFHLYNHLISTAAIM